jgi:type II secretory pathway pseudopilin PulG
MNRIRRDDGFTIVELLVACGGALTVLLAALMLFDGFKASASDLDRRVDAADGARRALDVMARAVRGATPTPGSGGDAVLRLAPWDLVVAGYDGAAGTTGTTARRTRFCLEAATGRLWREELADEAAGPSLPGPACPARATGWSSEVLLTGVGTQVLVAGVPTDVPLFSGDAARRAVDLDLVQARDDLRLRSSAAVRSASGRGPGFSAGDVRVECSPDGSSALVTLDALVDAQGVPVDAAFATATGTPLGRGSIELEASAAPKVAQTVSVTVRNALGLEQAFPVEVVCT